MTDPAGLSDARRPLTPRRAMRLAPLLMLGLSGCSLFGAVGGVVAHAVPKQVDAAYKGLADQPTVIMVWADRGLAMDFPDLQTDLAASLQQKLIDVQKKDNPDALRKMTFPVDTATVIRYQQDHPELQAEPVTQTAAKFTGTRLIYVEVTDFATRSEASLELYRGVLTAHVRVVERTGDTAKVAYDGGDIHVEFPKDTPKDGLPVGRDYTIARGTIDAFVTDAAQRFYKHDEDRD